MKVEIYGAEWCSYCKQAVQLCESNGLQYDYIDIDKSTNLQSLTDRLGSKPRTVPQIFIDGKHTPGGYNEFLKSIRV